MATLQRNSYDYVDRGRGGSIGWPENVNDEFARWLMRHGVDMRTWYKITQPQRNWLRAMASESGIAGTNPNSHAAMVPVRITTEHAAQVAKDTGTDTRSEAYRKKYGGEAPAGPVSQSTLDQSAGLGADFGSLGGGGADELADPFFYDFIPGPFMPRTDRFVSGALNALGAAVLGRALHPDEMQKAMAHYRAYEKNVYNNEIRKARSEWAADTLKQEQEFRAGQKAGEVKGFTEEQQTLLSQAHHDLGSFNLYNEEDMQYQMYDVLNRLAPVDATGQQMRSSLQGLAAAIQGVVNVDRFAR